MNEQLLSISGIVRECAVIPRTNAEGNRRDYVLMTIASNGQLVQFVSGATYFSKLTANYGIITPVVDTDSLPVDGLIGKAVELLYEQAIKGRTQYIGDDGELKTHKNSGNNLRKLFVLDDKSTESSAYRNAHLESQGVSEFAISTAAKQQMQMLEQAFQMIKSTPNVPQRREQPEPPVIKDIEPPKEKVAAGDEKKATSKK